MSQSMRASPRATDPNTVTASTFGAVARPTRVSISIELATERRVERRDVRDAESLGHGDDGGVCGAEGEVVVLLDEICHPHVVLACQVDQYEVAVGDRPQEGRLRRWPG